MKITHFGQSALKFAEKKTIYFDPFDISKDYHDADYIFITHDHYDHFDLDSIKNVMKDSTKFIVPKIMETEVKISTNILLVEPNKEYKLDNLEFKTIPAYNVDKTYHPKEKGFVGYNMNINNIWYYIMGDTDVTDEAKGVKCDYCFVPIGGTYTMDYKEASDYINHLKPKKVMPIHYGTIVGDISLGNEFKKLINKDIEVIL